jgi:hypothetical protein
MLVRSMVVRGILQTVAVLGDLVAATLMSGRA